MSTAASPPSFSGVRVVSMVVLPRDGGARVCGDVGAGVVAAVSIGGFWHAMPAPVAHRVGIRQAGKKAAACQG